MSNAIDVFRNALKPHYKNMQGVLPAGIDAARVCNEALGVLQRNPDLQKCHPESFALAVIKSAELGLSMSLGLCHPVRYNKTCELLVDYKGDIQLAYRSGLVKRITADVVREGDIFRWQRGTAPRIDHQPNSATGDPLLYTYACAWIGDEKEPVFVVLDAKDIARRRACSQNANGQYSPWVNHPEPMWKKSSVHELSKYIPMSIEMQIAMQYSNAAMTGPGLFSAEVVSNEPPLADLQPWKGDGNDEPNDEPNTDGDGGKLL